MRVFVTSVCRLSSTGFWMTASFLQVSKTLLNILADLNNTVVWMVSICPLIPMSSCLIISRLVTYWAHQLQLISLSYYYNHHHHHVVLVARISLTLSRHVSLSFIASGRSSGQHPVSSHSCWMYFRAGRPVLHGHLWGSIRVHHLWVRPCFSSCVLHVWFV